MDEKKTITRIFQWDHIKRGKVQRLDILIHCPYNVWHSIIIARCLSRIPPYHFASLFHSVILVKLGQRPSIAVHQGNSTSIAKC